MQAGQDILQNRHPREHVAGLEGAPQASGGDLAELLARYGNAVQQHVAFVGWIDSAYDIEQRGLAGAVRTDDAVNFPLGLVNSIVWNLEF